MTSRRQPTEWGLARRQLGVDGEVLAAQWYENRGYTVVDRNWRCREGEIDLIVRNTSSLIFCEVKTRTSDRFGSPLDAVTVAKQRRLRMLATRWLADNRADHTRNVRFDVAAVTGRDVLVIESAF